MVYPFLRGPFFLPSFSFLLPLPPVVRPLRHRPPFPPFPHCICIYIPSAPSSFHSLHLSIHAHHGHRPFVFLFPQSCPCSGIDFFSPTQISAQAPTSAPGPVQEFAFARSGSKLYVNGGRYVLNGTMVTQSGQLYSLDLSQSWSVNNPPWQQLSPSSPPAYFYYMVATPDNNTLYKIQMAADNSMNVYPYSIPLNAWLPNTMTLPATTESRQGVRPILDPTSWLIYLDATTYMDVFNPNNTGTTSTLTMPPNTFTSRLFSGGCYNKARHSIMYYGGLNYSIAFDPLATYVTEYSISGNTWTNFVSEAGATHIQHCNACLLLTPLNSFP